MIRRRGAGGCLAGVRVEERRSVRLSGSRERCRGIVGTTQSTSEPGWIKREIGHQKDSPWSSGVSLFLLSSFFFPLFFLLYFPLSGSRSPVIAR